VVIFSNSIIFTLLVCIHRWFGVTKVGVMCHVATAGSWRTNIEFFLFRVLRWHGNVFAAKVEFFLVVGFANFLCTNQ